MMRSVALFLTARPAARLLLSAALACSLLGSTMPPQPAFALSLPAMPQSFHPGLVADVAEMVAPSVVNIDVEKSVRRPAADLSGLPFGDELFRRFFGIDPGSGGFSPFGPGGGSSSQTVSGNGSGLIISKDGHILTNNHVVNGADKITVTLNDGRQFVARMIGRDSHSDIAVIKIDAPNLVPATLGSSSKLRPGEWVIAVGSPLGFDHTVTLGIVSALSRRIPDLNSTLSYIQTDAAINPGNSGGPLINLKGEVVGLNTAISGRGQNIGFAIPIDDVKQVSDILIAGKPIVRPWLGISMVALNPDLAKHVGLPPETKGIVVAQVMQNSPASKAGLRQGDVIQKIDGKSVLKAETVKEAVQARPINSQTSLDVLRGGQLVSLSLTSEQLPDSSEAMVPFRPRVSPGR